MSQPRLRMFAGPNGSGKTTLVRSLAKEFSPDGVFLIRRFVNADDILAQLKKGQALDLAEYSLHITLEQLAAKMLAGGRLAADHPFFKAVGISDSKLAAPVESSDSYVAAALADLIREHLIETSQSFAFETVMSHRNKVDFFARARAKGYRTFLYFIATKSPLLNIHRVSNRADRGGHDVTDEKITRRYQRALTLVADAPWGTRIEHFCLTTRGPSPF